MEGKDNVLVLSADPEISSVIMRLIGGFEEFAGTLCQSVDTLLTPYLKYFQVGIFISCCWVQGFWHQQKSK